MIDTPSLINTTKSCDEQFNFSVFIANEVYGEFGETMIKQMVAISENASNCYYQINSTEIKR
jgi:hypothetical protein